MKTIIILFLSFTLHLCNGQEKRDSTALVQIETADGNAYIGKVVFEDLEKITLTTEKLGELTFKRMDVVKITRSKKISSSAVHIGLKTPRPRATFFLPMDSA